MDNSLQDYLNVVKPHLPEVIVSRQTLASLEKLANLLPIGSMILLESRLADNQPRIDLSLGFGPTRLFPSDALIASLFWQKIQLFSEIWTTKGSIINQNIEDIWLEFDLDQETDILTIPCYFLTIKEAIFKNQNPKIVVEKILKLMSALNLQSFTDTQIKLLEKCLNSLPTSAKIVQLGSMLTRNSKPLRVNIQGLSGSQITDYLATITDQAIDENLLEIISIFEVFTDRIVLTFDLETDTIGTRIGLECFLEKQVKKEPRWTQFLDHLVKIECCTLEKRNALLNWPGLIQKKDHQHLWPENLTRLEPWMNQDIKSVFFRTINHLKLVYQPNIPLEAKAYLGFGHRWFDCSKSLPVE
jgi:hypothetical protein